MKEMEEKELSDNIMNYVKVTDSQGRDILVNDQETSVAMKQTTAYFMNELLTTAVEKGTGKSARFDGMPIAGKTGTVIHQ